MTHDTPANAASPTTAMRRRRLAAYAVTIALLAAELVIVATMPPPRTVPGVGLRTELPQRVGTYVGEELRYCHNEQCTAPVHRLATLANPNVCPACGGPLYEKSLAETLLLPGDTTVTRKRYCAPDGDAVTVAIVFSGTDRRSIHRPQVCLVSQGNTITKERVIEVPLDGRPPLQVMLLDLLRGGNTGNSVLGQSCYAYWFVSGTRETPSHLRRLVWMAWDSIVHGTHRQWAYVTVSTRRAPEGDAHVARVSDFIAHLYPLLVELAASAPAGRTDGGSPVEPAP